MTASAAIGCPCDWPWITLVGLILDISGAVLLLTALSVTDDSILEQAFLPRAPRDSADLRDLPPFHLPRMLSSIEDAARAKVGVAFLLLGFLMQGLGAITDPKAVSAPINAAVILLLVLPALIWKPLVDHLARERIVSVLRRKTSYLVDLPLDENKSDLAFEGAEWMTEVQRQVLLLADDPAHSYLKGAIPRIEAIAREAAGKVLGVGPDEIPEVPFD
ncbi:MAG: hypothetical protein JWN41_647 [Thermoleophilia bacterium]|nr:hypothetical protein [Thermoleophilia bacterium]